MCTLNTILIKTGFFKEVEKLFLKLIRRNKDAQIAKLVLEMIRGPGTNKTMGQKRKSLYNGSGYFDNHGAIYPWGKCTAERTIPMYGRKCGGKNQTMRLKIKNVGRGLYDLGPTRGRIFMQHDVTIDKPWMDLTT